MCSVSEAADPRQEVDGELRKDGGNQLDPSLAVLLHAEAESAVFRLWIHFCYA